jgi:hypothetical protein
VRGSECWGFEKGAKDKNREMGGEKVKRENRKLPI